MIAKLLDRIGWRKLRQSHKKAGRSELLTSLSVVAISSAIAAGVTMGLRSLNLLEALELVAYDNMVQLKLHLGLNPSPDPRILVVGITDQDISNQRKWPIPDGAIAQALAELQKHQPAVIGLDILRDIPVPPGHDAFIAQLQQPNVVVITSYVSEDPVPPPPTVPPERVGFNDVVLDTDNAIRRNLLFVTGEKTLYSFAYQSARRYFASRGIPVGETANREIQIGSTIFPQLKPNSGGYQNVDAGGYQIMLSYRSKVVAPQVSLTDVLEGKLKPEQVRGKVILIGATTPTAKDLFNTPYSPWETGNPQMAGVVIHAQMVSQLLSGVLDGKSPMWFWDEWVEVLWIIGWSVGSALLAWTIRHPVLLGLAGTSLLISLAGGSFGLFLLQGWVPVVAPAIASILSGISLLIYETQQTRQQRHTIMRLLGQQVDPKVAQALWQARDELLESGILAGQNITATILFTDIKNFSSISEIKVPNTVMGWLNEYLRAMTQEVQNHQGIVNKFTGDGLMAVFGVPIPSMTEAERAADAQRAVACALAMGDRLAQLNEDWAKRQLPVVQMRVGIATGSVMVGSLGGENRLEYGVIGDSVNTAARLESYKKERQERLCRVLIMGKTLDYLGELFEVEFWGALELRGKQNKVDVYQVLGYKQSSDVAVQVEQHR